MRISDWSSDVCSSDLRPTTDVARNTGFGALAQLGERLLCKHQVIGSIPIGSTIAAHRLCRARSEEHTSELQSLMRISYAVFCLKKKKQTQHKQQHNRNKREISSINNNITNT